MKDSPMSVALRDIKADLLKEHKKLYTSYARPKGGAYKDYWFCFGELLYNSEQRNLNRQLGLHSINRFK